MSLHSRAAASANIDTPPNIQVQLRKTLTAYGFLLPWLCGMLFLTVGAMFFTFYLGFTNYDLISQAHWTGLRNFKQIFSQDTNFWVSLRATIIYVAVSVPSRIVISLLVAMLLSRNIGGIGIYRSLMYLPSLLGGSVGVSIGWQRLFSSTGPINSMLHSLGINAPIWLGSPHLAIFVLVIMSVWQFGSEMVIFLAGLKQIPHILYESARIDGATSIQSFFRITIPMLSPIIFFNVIMGTISSFMVFTQVYIITGGGPMNSTLFFVLYIYQQAFQFLHMGYAAALSMILLFIIAVFSGLLFLTNRYWVSYDV